LRLVNVVNVVIVVIVVIVVTVAPWLTSLVGEGFEAEAGNRISASAETDRISVSANWALANAWPERFPRRLNSGSLGSSALQLASLAYESVEQELSFFISPHYADIYSTII
jgi:hypothetical protein